MFAFRHVCIVCAYISIASSEDSAQLSTQFKKKGTGNIVWCGAGAIIYVFFSLHYLCVYVFKVESRRWSIVTFTIGYSDEFCNIKDIKNYMV